MTILKFGIRGLTATLLLLSTVAGASEVRWTFDGDIHNNSLAVSPDEKTAVASYSERSDVVIYDLAAGKVRKVLKGYITPRNALFSPDGKAFYLSDSSLGVVKKISSGALDTTATLPLGAGAFGTAISSDGQRLFVNNEAASTLSIYDLIHSRPVKVITGFAEPRQGIKLSPDGKTVYVTNFKGDKITLVDAYSGEISGEIEGFNKLRAISVTSDGNTLYAANSGSNTIAVVDTQKRVIISTIPVGKDPYGAALSPDNRYVYSGNLGDNSLSVIDTGTGKVVSTVTGLDAPRQAIVFSKDGSRAWVLNKDLSIAVVDLKQNRVTATIKSPPQT
ncbi:YncE family protein [Rahnella variigena]|jgi:YVTN family beta-propeller protein|uniref:YncE family protein n=1 Tax=Rahnella variigena TaxID=574964 RepID=UPI000DEB99B7|nr:MULTISPECIES: beta-propeller fold lactonase family protein [Rahnella]RBQ33691.1 phosphate ABC transporter substrate-binding protein [Rahnella aquatilis]